MKPGDYRREYAAYCAASARARYEYHVGRVPELRLAPLRERYADLWTRERINELEQAERDTPAQFETERTALQRLLNIARLGYVAAQTREVATELTLCERAAQIVLNGARINAADVPDLLAHEPDATRRRELAARWHDALLTCDDLRTAYLTALNTTANALSFASYFALRNEATQTDEQTITAPGRVEHVAVEYAATLTDATNFAYDPALHLWASTKHLRMIDAFAAPQQLAPAAALRARLFAAALGEHLRTRHGLRWWAVRAAGDELIDLWNTGARYTVEELAALVGTGALDVELLADALLRG